MGSVDFKRGLEILVGFLFMCIIEYELKGTIYLVTLAMLLSIAISIGLYGEYQTKFMQRRMDRLKDVLRKNGYGVKSGPLANILLLDDLRIAPLSTFLLFAIACVCGFIGWVFALLNFESGSHFSRSLFFYDYLMFISMAIIATLVLDKMLAYLGIWLVKKFEIADLLNIQPDPEGWAKRNRNEFP